MPAVRTLRLLALIILALLATLVVYLAPLKPGVLALQLTFTPSAFGSVIHQWSAVDLHRYRSHFPADFALLLAYGAFGIVYVRTAASFSATGPRRRLFASLALPAAAACDATENALHLWLTEAPRFGVASLYFLSGSIALGKWLLLMTFGLFVARAFRQTEALYLPEDRKRE